MKGSQVLLGSLHFWGVATAQKYRHPSFCWDPSNTLDWHVQKATDWPFSLAIDRGRIDS